MINLFNNKKEKETDQTEEDILHRRIADKPVTVRTPEGVTTMIIDANGNQVRVMKGEF